MLRKIIFVIVASIVFLPGMAFAQEIKVPELNPICWREADCQKQRVALNSEAEKKEGWVGDQIECPGKDWGKCLPASIATTQIAFGGQNKFLNIGVFIQQIYKYAVGVASILAVVMIVIAGAQWTASGGNSEVITGAKKRITGALLGLLIAYGSYFILNTVNPALVNLRLPQVYMLKPQKLLPQFCSDVSDEVKLKPDAFALAADSTDQTKPVTLDSKAEFKYTFKNQSASDNNEKNFFCGKRFFVKDGGATTCKGNYCDPGSGCLAFGDDPKHLEECKKGAIIGGSISSSALVEPGCIAGSAGYYYPYINSTGGIEVLCKKKVAEGKVFIDSALYGVSSLEVKDNDAKKTQSYAAVLDKTALDKPCQSENSEVVGYVLQLRLIDHTCGVAPSSWLFGKRGKVLVRVNAPTEGEVLTALTGSDIFSKEELLKGNIMMNIDTTSIPE